MRLAAILVDTGRLPASRVEEAERRSRDEGRPLGEILVEDGDLTPEVRAELEARALGIPFLAPVPDDVFDAELIARLPVEWTRTHRALPVRHGGGRRRCWPARRLCRPSKTWPFCSEATLPPC